MQGAAPPSDAKATGKPRVGYAEKYAISPVLMVRTDAADAARLRAELLKLTTPTVNAGAHEIRDRDGRNDQNDGHHDQQLNE